MSSSYINRELSWLEFNQRVLGEALNTKLPLLERLKFLAITGSNLDEFFQVRVGGLEASKHAGSRAKDITGLTPSQQLKLIHARADKMIRDQDDLLTTDLIPALVKESIFLAKPSTLPPNIQKIFRERFTNKCSPLLTPVCLDEDLPPPFLKSLQIYCLCTLADEKDQRQILISIPDALDRFEVHVDETGTYIVSVEELVAKHVDTLFPGEKVTQSAIFRVTRNADIILEDEDAGNLANEMADVLSQRKFGHAVRIEIQAGASRELTKVIKSFGSEKSSQFYRVSRYLAFSDFMSIAFMGGFDHLREENWSPQPSSAVDPTLSMFENISKGDILLHHPYESFDPVVRLIEEAAQDPQTLAIKQVLYRTAKNSCIIDSLLKAAALGKQVTVLVELKARFDEANNLQRADELLSAGVQIVYGVKNLKTHAKIAMIIRNEGGSLVRYLHLGTGNYNESTAKIYTDISYLTKKSDYGSDASTFFNAVTGRSQLSRFSHLLPAPTHMKKHLLERIRSEAQRAKNGEKALIMAKVNSLQDKEIIDALYSASKAGVTIKINVRGVCCLKTGSRKEAANIHVVSIIDRYLEHARIFYFHQGGDTELYIASADWMTRNLDKRIELMIPIEDKSSKQKLTKILESAFKDNTNSHLILTDGTSEKITTKNKSFRLQKNCQQRAEQAYAKLKQKQTTTFEPHTPN